jgi:tetratricopeptide (TPR) repeat protein
VEPASSCCNELVGLSLAYGDESSVDQGKHIFKMNASRNNDKIVCFSGPSRLPKTLKRNVNVKVVSLDVTLPSLQTTDDQNLEIDSFDDECLCISKLLLIKDKLIYFVVSASVGEFVVPLIYKHRCIEHIYIYQDSNNEDIKWIDDYPKTSINGLSIDELAKQIKQDIDSIMQRPSRWSRSKTLLTELNFQTSQTDLFTAIKDIPKEDVSKLRIVTLFFGMHKLFSHSQSQIDIDEFNNIDECIQSIKAQNFITIFLIISIDGSNDIHPLFELDDIHAIYIVPSGDYNEQIQTISMHPKVSGVFGLDEDLLEQLITDICFYRHMRICTPKINTFQIGSNIIENSDEQQINFLCFQLFSNILPELSTQLDATAQRKAEHISRLLSLLIDTNIDINDLFKQFDTSVLLRSVSHIQEFNQRIMASTTTSDSSSVTVYRAQLVSKKDLELIQKNSQALLSIPTFILASRSFRTIANICRQAADSQLTVILFELNLAEDVPRAELDADRIAFGLGTLFRLVSTESTPDGVWRTQLESADRAMQCIKDQLKLEVGGRLTWLTFGNYLTALKRFDAAEGYYKYLLEVLPNDHPSLASIYNNMGLMYSMKENDQAALEWFGKALELKVTNSLPAAPQEKSSIEDELPLQHKSIDRLTILSKLADLNNHQGNHLEALNYYRQALELSTNVTLRVFFQAKIEAILLSHSTS